jgi:hypothetical protein
MNKKIVNPYWGNDEKTQVVCTFEYEDGTSLTASVMNTNDGEDNNPDWDQVFVDNKIEDVNTATNVRLEAKDIKEEDIIIQSKAEREKKKNEDIFQAKIDAFQIEEVKLSNDRVIKAKIRKAKTLTEVIAYSTILIMSANSEETNTTPTAAKTKAKATPKKK